MFHGDVAGLCDGITVQGTSVAALKTAFKQSVEDTLALCKECHEAPEQPFSGQFIMPTTPTAHREAALLAKRQGVCLNA